LHSVAARRLVDLWRSETARRRREETLIEVQFVDQDEV